MGRETHLRAVSARRILVVEIRYPLNVAQTGGALATVLVVAVLKAIPGFRGTFSPHPAGQRRQDTTMWSQGPKSLAQEDDSPKHGPKESLISGATVGVLAYCIYPILLAIVYMLMLNVPLELSGFQPTRGPWIRVAAAMVVIAGYYHVHAVRSSLTAFSLPPDTTLPRFLPHLRGSLGGFWTGGTQAAPLHGHRPGGRQLDRPDAAT